MLRREPRAVLADIKRSGGEDLLKAERLGSDDLLEVPSDRLGGEDLLEAECFGGEICFRRSGFVVKSRLRSEDLLGGGAG